MVQSINANAAAWLTAKKPTIKKHDKNNKIFFFISTSFHNFYF
ncbi:conserved hypothetical protein [delta proteobacterium NaphS2]|nr:conserved hypothetical protein [delta proteobacterium NaphS2]